MEDRRPSKQPRKGWEGLARFLDLSSFTISVPHPEGSLIPCEVPLGAAIFHSPSNLLTQLLQQCARSPEFSLSP